MKQEQPAGAVSRKGSARERRTGRPSLEQAENIERIILETATALYLHEGAGVTMKAIVQASGLSSKTIYARYPNKEALFLGVLRSLLQKATPPMDLSRSDGADVHDTLREFVLRSLQATFRAESVALHRMASADPGFGRELGAEIFQTIGRIFFEPLAVYLERQRAAGRIRQIDARRTAHALTTQILAEPATTHVANAPTPNDAEMVARAAFIADLFFNGVKRAEG